MRIIAKTLNHQSHHKKELTERLRRKALEIGFDACGFSKAEFLADEAPKLESWLSQGSQGKMDYMANHFDKRLDPRLLVEGAKSVISLTYNYFPEEDLFVDSEIKISKYAYGRDYHKVVKSRLKELLLFLQEQVGEISARIFVDSAPVLEKAWAQRAGLGWLGKHSNILSKGKGSFFFLAELICDVEFEYDAPVADHCGSCTRCIDACPTDAIFAPYQVDGSRCISYLTIELKEAIPKEFNGKMEGWAFGCDICQDVCPWNRFSKPHSEPDFNPKDAVKMNVDEWEDLTEAVFEEIFNGSPIKRTKFSGLKRNIRFLKE